MQDDSTTSPLSPSRPKAPNKSCPDCGIAISRTAKRCHPCAMRVRDAHAVPWTAERRQHQSVVLRAYYENEEARARRSEIVKASRTELTRQKQSEASKRLYDDPKRRQKRSEDMKAGWQAGLFANAHSDEARMKQSADMKRRWKEGAYSRTHTEEWRQLASSLRKQAWAIGMYGSPEWRQRISESRIHDHVKGVYDGVFRSPTSIEIAVSEALDGLAVIHICQFRPPKCGYVFDEFVPPLLLIEVHGTYWHSDPRSYDKGQLTAIQLDRCERDQRKARWAVEHGYRLAVFWEADIRTLGADALIRRVLAHE